MRVQVKGVNGIYFAFILFLFLEISVEIVKAKVIYHQELEGKSLAGWQGQFNLICVYHLILSLPLLHLTLNIHVTRHLEYILIFYNAA